MDYTFLNDIKKIAKDGFTKQEKTAYDSIIDMLFKKKKYGKEKATGIDEYDGESLFSGGTLYPGQIYGFVYKAETLSTYMIGNNKFVFYDKLPLVLITHVSGNSVRGINLNLCPFQLKTYILNALINLDLEFYNKESQKMARTGKAPISTNVAKVFLNRDTERQFIQYIVKQCKLQNTDILYRQYQVDKIKDIRMIEVWQYKYLPFLTYNGELKKDVLQHIYQATGTMNIQF